MEESAKRGRRDVRKEKKQVNPVGVCRIMVSKHCVRVSAGMSGKGNGKSGRSLLGIGRGNDSERAGGRITEGAGRYQVRIIGASQTVQSLMCK